ncbi:hypothetical protein D5S18_06820 [Nocardia panacis]|uniref:Uncharacterized protein n=1 Tax=Nocardia panacis TaxID=2340916 RepID=A0A3A4KPY8_9NOCA|nr:hypothetical protein [Nocardia panacis]RJO77976.1 hypothetical protein D5S18_06820 [Nocardia panacis]
MSYDHVLLPSGVVSTHAEADAYLMGQQGLPETAAVAALAARINEADAEAGAENSFLSVDSVGGAPTGAALHVPSPYDAIGHVRRLLFDLATPADYAIYDPQLSWLIDPLGHVPVTVQHGGAGEFPYLTKPLAEQWVSSLMPPNPYLVVEREPQDYIQTYQDKSGIFTLEYRDGSPDRHFGLTLRDSAMVSTLIWEWATGDRTRLNTLPWTRVDL